MRLQSTILLLPAFLKGSASAVAEPLFCKCMPDDNCWPSFDQWDTFNDTISGQLIETVPPGIVCYVSRPEFNQKACDILLTEWKVSSFHSSNPFTPQGTLPPDESCNPIYPNGTSVTGDLKAGERGCSLGSLPPYVVNATESAHVVEAVKFARQHNLRFNIKNTGHAGYEKNTAHGSLSVWTHNMKKMEFHPSFPFGACESNETTMAVTIGAGVQSGEFHAANAENNVMGVSGTNLDVGIVGWALGGGHGYTTGRYGMGADNILEATMVTPSGELLTVNSCQNTDLFWAIRGGGGTTFGIIIDMTVRVYPMPSLSLWSFNMSPKNATSTKDWWKTVSEFHKHLPAAHEAGVQGYYNIEGPPSSASLTMGGVLFSWGSKNGTIQKAVGPLERMLENSNSRIQSTTTFSDVPTFYEFIQSLPAMDGAGTERGVAASRLLSRDAVTTKPEALARTFEIIGPGPEAPTNGTPSPSISGTLTSSWKPVNNSLNPAWRDTVVHVVSSHYWDDSLSAELVKTIVDHSKYTKIEALRELDPASGTYLNEASASEPGWQHSFFGPNYPRLRSIKADYDPEDLLWCPTCVGSEGWIQRQDGALCRVYSPY